MSWIDKELRKRQKIEARGRGDNSVAAAGAGVDDQSERIAALWERFENTNNALPAELRLPRETYSAGSLAPDGSMLRVAILSNNGSGIGFTGDAIRYFWPKANPRRSNNFWIKSHADSGYLLSRRVKPSLLGPSMNERAFDERSIDHIIRCLVTAKRVRWRSVGKRRFWFF